LRGWCWIPRWICGTRSSVGSSWICCRLCFSGPLVSWRPACPSEWHLLDAATELRPDLPVLLGSGTQDPVVDPQVAHRMAERLGERCTLWEAPGKYHAVLVTNPGFARAVAKFLEGALAESPPWESWHQRRPPVLCAWVLSGSCPTSHFGSVRGPVPSAVECARPGADDSFPAPGVPPEPAPASSPEKRVLSMKTFAVLPLALAMTFATACSSIPTSDIQIQTEAAPKANFSGYKSYAWLGAATLVSDAAGQWKAPGFDLDNEVKHLIDRELRARGMSESRSQPDLVVAFALGVDMDSLKLKMNPETKLDVLANVPTGGLMTVMVDASTGFVIWAGVAGAEITPGIDAKTAKGRLDYAVTQMLKELPQ
jgi:hypothetical protein